MKTKNLPEEMVEDEQYQTPQEYFSKDINLLILLIFLEDFKGRSIKIFRLNSFYKGDYWSSEDFSEYLPDESFSSNAERFYYQIALLLQDLKIGRLVKSGMVDYEDAVKSIIDKISMLGAIKSPDEKDYYFTVLEHIFFLRNQRDAVYEKQIQKALKKEGWESILKEKQGKDVFYEVDRDYMEMWQLIIQEVPNEMVMFFEYNEKQINEIGGLLNKYIEDFSEHNEHTDLTITIHFEKQIDNFFRYIYTLNPIREYVDIPFTSINEKNFEVVKILRYLESKNTISINWADDTHWKVRFLQMPISPELVFPKNVIPEPQKQEKVKNEDIRLKPDLNFDTVRSLLWVDGNSIKITGKEQKQFLKIIFAQPENLTNEMFFSEIAEMFDFVQNFNEKRFYGIAYNLNSRILKDTGNKEFFILTKQTCRINPIYL